VLNLQTSKQPNRGTRENQEEKKKKEEEKEKFVTTIFHTHRLIQEKECQIIKL
jgi:hypothetical protein